VDYFDDVHVSEDFLLSRKITDLGFKILFDPQAKVLHFGVKPAMHMLSYIRKELNRGKNHYRTQLINQNLFGRLPISPFVSIPFYPSIVIMRGFRELIKVGRASTFRNSVLFLPHIIVGALIWSTAYIKEAYAS
jgi:hypothetical protein